MEQQAQVTQKTGLKVSQAVGLALVLLSGAAGGAVMLQASSQLNAVSKTTTSGAQTSTSTNTNTSIDLTTQETPKADFTSAAYSQATATSVTTLANDVSVRITSPTEGATANGATPVTVELTDPNKRAAAVRVRLYSDLLPAYMQGVSFGNDSTPPYTFTPNLAMYPSGEYLYVAEAVKFDSSIPGADTAVVIATSDTMVTWVRTCYYLAYQGMTLNAPTSSVTLGDTFTLTGSVKNHMRGNCQNIYNLTAPTSGPVATLPSGWTATFSPTSLNLGIGATGQFKMTIKTTPGSIVNGSTTGSVTVGATSNRQGTGFTVTKSVNVNVESPSGGGGRDPIETQ